MLYGNSIWIIYYESLFDNLLHNQNFTLKCDIIRSSHGAFFRFSPMAMVCSLYASKLFVPYLRNKRGTCELLSTSRFVSYIYGHSRFVI